ncbi:hypothetical protein Tco_0910165 [Tanacetum coccineum]|uniref:Uncharacterized protein n=1 Tax=Tanacetum coccineum TaxID=301880 RepID=A0ABQ5CTC0_9ASTR
MWARLLWSDTLTVCVGHMRVEPETVLLLQYGTFLTVKAEFEYSLHFVISWEGWLVLILNVDAGEEDENKVQELPRHKWLKDKAKGLEEETGSASSGSSVDYD